MRKPRSRRIKWLVQDPKPLSSLSLGQNSTTYLTFILKFLSGRRRTSVPWNQEILLTEKLWYNSINWCTFLKSFSNKTKMRLGLTFWLLFSKVDEWQTIKSTSGYKSILRFIWSVWQYGNMGFTTSLSLPMFKSRHHLHCVTLIKWLIWFHFLTHKMGKTTKSTVQGYEEDSCNIVYNYHRD